MRELFGLPVEPAAGQLSPREEFNRRYRQFRSLLTANNNALEIMAEMEQALAAGQPFGMALVRGHCTAMSVNVYKMIQHLRGIADGRYPELVPAFQEVSRQVEEVLARRPPVSEGRLIMPLAEIDRHAADLVGEKMANLGEIHRHAGLRVPAGFAVTGVASRNFIIANHLQDEINRRLKTLDSDNLEELYRVSAAIQGLIVVAPLPADLEEALLAAYQELAEATGAGEELRVAMRSSAVGEDRHSVSFAGQYRTQLNVEREFVSRAYKEIVAGKYKSEAIVYRLRRGFRHQDVDMGVGCLAMVAAVVSGVMYSRAPEDHGSDWLVITTAPGLAAKVVDGSIAVDTLRVGRRAPHAVMVVEQRAGGPDADLLLAEEQIRELAAAALRLEEHFAAPQDIEWSFDRQGRLFILQSRPLGHPAPSEAAPAAAGPPSEPDEPDLLLKGGITASPGAACGPVFMVRNSLDLLRFPKGAVLVTAHPLPEWATLLSRAVAVVSETGQVAAHLATVAREFGVPALFGMAGAIAKLANEGEITVDATRRRVYSGRREESLAVLAPPPNLMADSPIYHILRDALALITPLNLTDPASPFFRPSSCRTMHDLTRFCHEKGVSEMFSFGARMGYDDKSAKQLVGEMPSQWWVIDLEDGFREDFDRHQKFIRIEDIVSAPMLAIWQGMTVVPWAGPPPVSLRGFGSILFQSTMNPNLDPAVRSSMGARNYFLVSRNFCNLSVRLGYHFALAEAHLGPLLLENYVSFQFKGGAADEGRRLGRVQLLKDILEHFDFRVELKLDALTARIERKPPEFLAPRLMVLGYLLIHTRQIDMVMGDEGMVEHYRQKIMAGLERLWQNGFQPEQLEQRE